VSHRAVRSSIAAAVVAAAITAPVGAATAATASQAPPASVGTQISKTGALGQLAIGTPLATVTSLLGQPTSTVDNNELVALYTFGTYGIQLQTPPGSGGPVTAIFLSSSQYHLPGGINVGDKGGPAVAAFKKAFKNATCPATAKTTGCWAKVSATSQIQYGVADGRVATLQIVGLGRSAG
jgi:hypothetical protein